MNDNQFNQGGMGVPPVNNNPQGGVPPVNPMPQPMPQQPMMNQPMPQPMPQQPMMNQPMPQPMPNPMGGQPMPQAGFNPGMAPQKKKSPVGLIIVGVIAAIVAFVVVWNVVLTKSFTCSEELFGTKLEITVKSRFDKIVGMKVAYTEEFDSADEAEEAYDELEDDDSCKDYDSGCTTFRTMVGKKVTYGVSLSGKALEEELNGESFDEDDLEKGKKYFEDMGMECK